MPLDLWRDKELWPWLEVKEASAEVGPGDYEHSEVKFDDMVLFGQYFSCSDDQSPGLFHVILSRNRIGFVPWDAPKCERLVAALSRYWGVDLPLKGDAWDSYDRKRGTDSRILWPTRYRGQALFEYHDVSLTDGILDKLERLVVGPSWEPSLSPLAIRLLTGDESGCE